MPGLGARSVPARGRRAGTYLHAVSLAPAGHGIVALALLGAAGDHLAVAEGGHVDGRSLVGVGLVVKVEGVDVVQRLGCG